MAVPSFSDMHRAVFTKEASDPDDLVECPFVSSHILKRKKLPIHLPECRAKNGRSFLACSYSQQHFFRTRDELKRHEVICPMRRQFQGTTQAAPSYQRLGPGEELSVNPMVKLLMQRRLLRAELEEQEEATAKELKRLEISGKFARENSESRKTTLFGGTDAQIKERLFHAKLHETVLYSKYRENQLLEKSVDLRGKWASDLAVVEEESDEMTDLTPKPAVPLPDCPAYQVERERERENQIRNNRSPSLRNRLANIGFAFNNRFEDDRDASDNPVNFFVDWSIYSSRYRAILRAKYNRDNQIYKTGENSRYRKCMDHPNSDRSGRPNPCQFEDLAAWYEDMVWKPMPQTAVPENTLKILDDVRERSEPMKAETTLERDHCKEMPNSKEDPKNFDQNFSRRFFASNDNIGIAY